MTRDQDGTGFRRLLRDERAAAAVEYVLLASLLSVAIIGPFHEIGDTLGGMFDDIAVILETINELMTEGNDFAN